VPTYAALSSVALDAVIGVLDADDRQLALFLLGLNRRTSGHVLYARRADDLVRNWQGLHVARRYLNVADGRGAIVWTSPLERHITWRVETVAKMVKVPVRIISSFAPPPDSATALEWYLLYRKTELLRRQVFNKGLRPLTLVMGSRGNARLAALAARDAPDLVERHPTVFRKGSRTRPRPYLQMEFWITQAGVQVAGAARDLADQQGIHWVEAMRMLAGHA
jgi:hypothetical protein